MVIYVDADACPVKEQVYRAAARYRVPVVVVANGFMRVPPAGATLVQVGDDPNAADDWIAARADAGAIVVTADVPLAARCVKAGAQVIAPTGRPFTEDSIGMTLATRNLMDSLRSAGEITGGPKPFAPRDRSAFLSGLDRAIVRLTRHASG